MKKLILMFAMSLSFLSFSQTKERKTIVKGVLLDFKIEQLISNQVDTVVYFYYGYQNLEYKTITDIGSIFFHKKEDLQQFVDALKELGNKEDGVNLDFSINKKYSLKLYDFSPKVIWLTDKEGKYTTIQKKQANKIATEIEQYINLLND
jgi:hypothetical protein